MAQQKPNFRTITVKLYPNKSQIKVLEAWLTACCWVYNQLLEKRTKAYQRRGDNFNHYAARTLLVGWRQRIGRLKTAPSDALRGAESQLDRAFTAFFRRVKNGEKPGYPRFRSRRRYRSLDINACSRYVRGNFIKVPKLGKIRFRGGDQKIAPLQKTLRIIRKESGWYAQLVFEIEPATPKPDPATIPDEQIVGIDLGLEHFAALSTGELVANPRCLRVAEQALTQAQRHLSRKHRGSANRKKAVQVVARLHERVAAQRLDFCHQLSRRLVNEFDVICHEALNVKGLARSKLAKSVHDAGWAIFLRQLEYKAEYAGKRAVAVNPAGTSQECPDCGAVKPKLLSERTHHCDNCGSHCQRDCASSRVVKARGLRVVRSSPVEGGSAARELVLVPLVRPPDEAGSFSHAG